MRVELQKSFPVPAAPEFGWTVLQSIEEVASCMPGAQITEQIDENNFKGEVRLKLGPARVAFKGDIEVKKIDAEARAVSLVGRGGDGKGTSASMDLSARIEPTDDGHFELVGESAVSLNGKLVSIGSRMINQVSEQILKQFGENFTARVQALAESGAPQADAPSAAAAPPPEPTSLNALALMWDIVRGWFARVFGRDRNE